MSEFRKPSPPKLGEGSSAGGKLTEATNASGGVVATAREERMCTGPVKPSRSQGERPWSKVGVGDNIKDLEGGRWACRC